MHDLREHGRGRWRRIYNWFGQSLTVDDTAVTDNSAGGHGGGIFSRGTAAVDLSEVTFSGNTPTDKDIG